VNCSISSPAALAFGSYDPVGANATANLDASPNALAVQCTKGAVAQIALDLGAHAQGNTRRMTSGGSNFLTYEIYTSAPRTTIWNATNTVTYTAASKEKTNLPVYGRIPAGQDGPSSGSYTDTIVATINF
jgi:spore coat protein U-like protein